MLRAVAEAEQHRGDLLTAEVADEVLLRHAQLAVCPLLSDLFEKREVQGVQLPVVGQADATHDQLRCALTIDLEERFQDLIANLKDGVRSLWLRLIQQ